jgi:hypothetical protein
MKVVNNFTWQRKEKRNEKSNMELGVTPLEPLQVKPLQKIYSTRIKKPR